MKFAKHTPKKPGLAICTPPLKLFFWPPRPSHPRPMPSDGPVNYLSPVVHKIYVHDDKIYKRKKKKKFQ